MQKPKNQVCHTLTPPKPKLQNKCKKPLKIMKPLIIVHQKKRNIYSTD